MTGIPCDQDIGIDKLCQLEALFCVLLNFCHSYLHFWTASVTQVYIFFPFLVVTATPILCLLFWLFTCWGTWAFDPLGFPLTWVFCLHAPAAVQHVPPSCLSSTWCLVQEAPLVQPFGKSPLLVVMQPQEAPVVHLSLWCQQHLMLSMGDH